MIHKRKHGDASERHDQAGGLLPFTLECRYSLADSAERLTRLINTQPRSDVDIFWIAEDKRRFHIASRAFRTHIIEADGYLTGLDERVTEISGEIYGDPARALIVRIGVLVILGVLLVLLMTGNFTVIVAGAAGIGAAAIYYRASLRRTREDQFLLARLIEDALS